VTEGEPGCSESELPLGSESRERAGASTTPRHLLCARPSRRARARRGARGEEGEGSRAAVAQSRASSMLHSLAVGNDIATKLRLTGSRGL